MFFIDPNIVFYGLKTLQSTCFTESEEMEILLLDIGCILDFI